MDPKQDFVINPSYYVRWKIQPKDFCRANKLDFIRANIIKYIMRYDAKDGIKDLEKALDYLKMLIEDYRLETGENLKQKQEEDWVAQAEKDLYGEHTIRTEQTGGASKVYKVRG